MNWLRNRILTDDATGGMSMHAGHRFGTVSGAVWSSLVKVTNLPPLYWFINYQLLVQTASASEMLKRTLGSGCYLKWQNACLSRSVVMALPRGVSNKPIVHPRLVRISPNYRIVMFGEWSRYHRDLKFGVL